MSKSRFFTFGSALLVVLIGGLLVAAQNKAASQDAERKIMEGEVPKAALDSLKKLAEKAVITEYAEEVEHGHKFYEGSWTGPSGKVDVLVTESGDLVETEEVVPADKVPAAVRAQAEKEAGKDVKVTFEKKTMVMYEVHFKKGEKGHEVLVTPDGRSQKERDKNGKEEKEDDDD